MVKRGQCDSATGVSTSFLKCKAQSFCLFLRMPFGSTSLIISCRFLSPSCCLPPSVPCIAWHLRAGLLLDLIILPQPSPDLLKNRAWHLWSVFHGGHCYRQSRSQFGCELIALWVLGTNFPGRNTCHRYEVADSAFTLEMHCAQLWLGKNCAHAGVLE